MVDLWDLASSSRGLMALLWSALSANGTTRRNEAMSESDGCYHLT